MLCKRIAKDFKLQRYIPQFQVYELCINWQSEIPTPPTIFYLSEIFIHPYTKHQSDDPQIRQDQFKLFHNKSRNPIGLVDRKSIDVHLNNKQATFVSNSQIQIIASHPKILDYDKISALAASVTVNKERKKQIIKHNQIRFESECKKKRKR